MIITKEFNAILENENLSEGQRMKELAKYMLDSPCEALSIFHIYYNEHPYRKDILPLLDFLTEEAYKYWNVRQANTTEYNQANEDEKKDWDYTKNPILVDTLNLN